MVLCPPWCRVWLSREQENWFKSSRFWYVNLYLQEEKGSVASRKWTNVIYQFVFQLSVRGKNKKEKLEDFFKNMVKSADGVIVSGVKVIEA